MLNGIDISSNNGGIDAGKVSADFVIVKATQDTGYTNPQFEPQMRKAEAAGKLLGVYHYVGGGGIDAEAKHFHSIIKKWVGKAVVCIDWESIQNQMWGNTAYLEKLCQKVEKLAGVKPVIYASASSFPFSLCRKHGWGTWVAQYADMNRTGYQDRPWNEGAYTCDIRQYSSCGRVGGYDGNLDLNKFYGDRAAWLKLAGAKDEKPAKEQKPKAEKPKAKKVEYKTGTYVTTVDALNVRTGAGTAYARKSKWQLTPDGQNHSNASGQLNKGTTVTVSKVKQVGEDWWGQIPSGWICLHYKGQAYVVRK